ncbi:MAG: DnaD domain protein [Ruminococcus sp.]|nr:DnaD domain protein [Ruminococcus sp.]
MSYKINLGAWGSVFAVPSALVDSHLKIATESQLKVLLYILRNSDADNSVESIAKAVSVHPDEVKNAVDFWIERELVASTDNLLSVAKTHDQIEKEESSTYAAPQKKPRAVSRSQRPDPTFVAKRLSENQELSHLMDEAQIALSKPLSSGDTATLVMLHDTDGLPCDVLLMLINFCVSNGKGNMRAIERMGTQWAADGIFSIELAEQKIISLSNSNNAWTKVSKIFGIKNVGSPTKAQLSYADTWCNDWKFSDDMLLEAYERCVNTKGEYNIKYINAILSKWHSAKIFNLDDLKAADESSSKAKKSKSNKPHNSINELDDYDIMMFKSKSLYND